VTRAACRRLFDAINDCFDLARHVLDRPDEYALDETLLRTVKRALAFEADSVEPLQRLASYVLFQLQWQAQVRPLTADEQRIQTIATKLYDAWDRVAQRDGQPTFAQQQDARRRVLS
jgi:hypothetical protein